jgi:hypothetical protein
MEIEMQNENQMTLAQQRFMWYTIAIQALHELGRPMLLKTSFVNEVLEGKWEVFGSRTDDGGYLYKAQEKET